MNTKKGGCRLKKKYNLLFILFLSSLLIACNSGDVKKADDSEVKASFRGTILEINNHIAIVSSEYREYSRIRVDLSVNSEVTFQVGDEIEVGYDGKIMESDPAQINTLSVELVE